MFGCSISPCLAEPLNSGGKNFGCSIYPLVRASFRRVSTEKIPLLPATKHDPNVTPEILKTRFEYHGARLRVTRRGRRHPSLREARWHQAEQPAGAWHAGDPLPSAHRAARPPQPRLHPILRRATLSCGCAATPTSAATATCAATPYPAHPASAGLSQSQSLSPNAHERPH